MELKNAPPVEAPRRYLQVPKMEGSPEAEDFSAIFWGGITFPLSRICYSFKIGEDSSILRYMKCLVMFLQGISEMPPNFLGWKKKTMILFPRKV